ncbi:MAG TPA: CDP-archaeol synthase [Anaerolineales bacterium]|nr:CDP-archaeol synthase [Anaerolineales bacterium]
MLRQRLIIALLIVPPGLLCIVQGGILFNLTLLAGYAIAAHEYAQMMQQGGHRPARLLIVAGVVLLASAQAAPVLWLELEARAWLLSGGVLMMLMVAATAWHMVDYERGAAASGTDWAVTLAGMIFLGWGCGYYIHLRALPDGMWWTFIVLPSIWLADSGAYIAGKRWGKHLMSPRLSPKKTWEGLVGGTVSGTLFGTFVGWLGSIALGPEATVGVMAGMSVGFVAAVASVLGDLGISMFKRQVGIKDTGNLLGAHGGLLDRIDSWLIAGPVAYFVIVLFFQ